MVEGNGSHRRVLPPTRRSWTQRAVINGSTCYLTCGEYQGGALGEVFVNVAKAGQDLRAMLEAFAMNFSVALQHGTPLTTLIATHKGFTFNPKGAVLHDDSGSQVTECSSIIDWVCQELENTYLKQP